MMALSITFALPRGMKPRWPINCCSGLERSLQVDLRLTARRHLRTGVEERPVGHACNAPSCLTEVVVDVFVGVAWSERSGGVA